MLYCAHLTWAFSARHKKVAKKRYCTHSPTNNDGVTKISKKFEFKKIELDHRTVSNKRQVIGRILSERDLAERDIRLCKKTNERISTKSKSSALNFIHALPLKTSIFLWKLCANWMLCYEYPRLLEFLRSYNTETPIEIRNVDMFFRIQKSAMTLIFVLVPHYSV